MGVVEELREISEYLDMFPKPAISPITLLKFSVHKLLHHCYDIISLLGNHLQSLSRVGLICCVAVSKSLYANIDMNWEIPW